MLAPRVRHDSFLHCCRFEITEMTDAGTGEGVAKHLRCDFLIRPHSRALAACLHGEVDPARADPEHGAVLRLWRRSKVCQRVGEAR